MLENLKSLDSLTINFSESSSNTLNIILAVIMLGVALGIKVSTFKDVFKHPKSLLVGLGLQWVMLPAVTFLFIMALNQYITPMVAMGMILVASCPGGNISNFMSSYARGNTELSVSMTAVSTCFAAFITPANFALWGGMYYRFLSGRVDTQSLPELSIEFLPMFEQVIVLLGIPIVLGMLFAHFYPTITAKITKPIQQLSTVVFVVLVAVAFIQNFDLFVNYISVVFVIVLIHNLLALGTGYFGARTFSLPKVDRRSLTIEVGIQNSGLGLVLLFNPDIFPQQGMGGMLFITAWWGVWHIISGLTVGSIFRYSK